MIITALLISTFVAPPRCTPARGDAPAILARAADAIGLARANGRVLRIDATDIVNNAFESDRPYEAPYIYQTTRITEWFDPSTGADRVRPLDSMIGGYSGPGPATLGGRLASYVALDTGLVPSAATHSGLAATRPLDVWALLSDWIAANDARVAERCELREYQRLVLARRGEHGTERLYIDPKSGYPVAYERTEPHYLWGDVAVRYVYATWLRVADAHVPGTATRVVDGMDDVTRTFGQVELVSRDSAPSLALPAVSSRMAEQLPAFLVPTNPDTVRVSATTFVLRNRGYAEAVTLARDTVFVFDATQGEARAREDSAWIAKLFPGRHAIALVVTDLAWPHVAGVRFWVARGATIISHRSSRAFLDTIVNRRWTAAPDLLERERARTPRMKFRAVDDSLRLAGGALTVFAIDGPASEGALAGFVHQDSFLWASDYVQNLQQSTQYLDEVAAAVRRMGYAPARLGAEHIPVSDWKNVAPLAEARRP